MLKGSSLYYLLAAASVGVLMSALTLGGAFRGLEEVTTDYRFQYRAQPQLADTSIVIVAIDNSSLQFFSENGLSWPWSRDTYAFLTETLIQAGARAILFDLLFTEADIDRFEVDSYYSDLRFAESLERHGDRTVIAAELIPGQQLFPLPEMPLSLEGIDTGSLPGFTQVNPPFLLFRNAARHIGVSNVIPDRGGIIRHTYDGFALDGAFVPSLAFRTLLAGGGELDAQQFRVQGHTYTIGDDSKRRIYWYGKPGHEGVFRYVSFAGVISAAHDPSADLSFFRDKIVVVGAYASGLLDYKPTPVVDDDAFPGMEIWATVLSNYLNNHFLSEPGRAGELLIIALLVLGSLLIGLTGSIWVMTAAALALAGGYVVVTLQVWDLYRMSLPLVSPLLTIVLSMTSLSVVSYYKEGRARREINTIFSRYMHPDVIKELVDNPDEIHFGGKMVNATIIFTDIASFTTHAEGKKPDVLVAELNAYLSDITETILDEGGLLDKFTGDGLMALFGVPLENSQHARMACLAALKHRDFSEHMARYHPDDPRLFFHRYTRIGINSGDILVGNIGSRRRMDYTAIGDDVNLAARLEGVNKVYGTRIIIGENTRAQLQEEFFCRELDFITVVGKEKPLKIYELLALNEFMPPEAREHFRNYERALGHYRSGDFALAKSMFETLSGQKVVMASFTYTETASTVMAARCGKLIENGPSEWSGIYKMDTK